MKKLIGYALLFVTVILVTLFASDWAQQSVRKFQTSQRQAAQQAEIVHTASRNKRIATELQKVITLMPGVTRLRVISFHQDNDTISGPVLRYDDAFVVTTPGTTPGALIQDYPFSMLGDNIDAMLAHRCALVRISDVHEANSLRRMTELKIVATLGCPIFNTSNELTGAVFANWEDPQAVPSDAASSDTIMMALAKFISDQYAS